MPYYKEETRKEETVKYLRYIDGKIQKSVYNRISELKITAWITSEPVTFDQRFSGVEKPLAIGQKWGELWDCAWFHFEGEVPQSAAGNTVVLLIDISGEACIVDRNGCPVQGLTNISSEYDRSLGLPGKRVFPLLKNAKGGEKVDMWADAGCNDLFGKYKDSGTVKEAAIAVCNEEMRELQYDFEVLSELMECIPGNKARHSSILRALSEAAGALNHYTFEEAKTARKILSFELGKKGGDPSLKISAIGHGHIDLAWLWPIRETIRKGARTFSTALAMMERYPDYIFGASQPQLYAWMKERYPDLYKKIKIRVEEGRWEAQGAMWVEADTNLVSGESLIRQILYGKNFFRTEFNKDMKVLWLPDTFGYSGALPQILKKSGVDYFMTTKLSWNVCNPFPYNTFIWKGIDGSGVLAHMPPEGTYNSSAAPRAIVKAENEYSEKGIADSCLLPFGIGDGGGGPGEEHLERLKREKDLNGLIPVCQEKSIDFFEHLAEKRDQYPEWSGELYLEKHQGTYTTQARNKRYNRKMEMALRECEFASVLAAIHSGAAYPRRRLEQIWKEVLLYQFHDILPGTSIKRVYDESAERYSVLLNETRALTEKAYLSAVNGMSDSIAKKSALAVFNSLSWERKKWLKLQDRWIYAKVPPMGVAVISAEDGDGGCNGRGDSGRAAGQAAGRTDFHVSAAEDKIENDLLCIRFSRKGPVISIYDKENRREVLAEGREANVLNVYGDDGDAWDFPINYWEKVPERFMLQSQETFIDGPMAGMKQTYRYNDSLFSQKVILMDGQRRIDFVTEVDWQEKYKMLRTAFPVDVTTDTAVCGIQFGNIKRSTLQNTSWQTARYEICAQKWADLSQGDYGVALLNDCKYGYRVKGNTLDLNLLRSPQFPGEEADYGRHAFTYSLYPHKGNEAEAKVEQAACELNADPALVALNAGDHCMKGSRSFIEVEDDSIVIDTVKLAEKDDDVIIRLYEATGRSVKTNIHFYFDFEQIRLVDLMEENPKAPVSIDGGVSLYFRPFEIHTLKIRPKC